jgi:fructose-1,6-bisphosphatase/inositol monophosphatase family enzyme
MTEADITAILSLLRKISAEQIMPRWRHLGAADIRTKSGPLDPVTIADEEAEKALGLGLKNLFPDTEMIGEEAVAKDRRLLTRLREPGKIWVIDPIDGTANFAADLPLWMNARDGRRKPLRVAAPAPLQEMTGSLSWRYMPQPMRAHILAHLDQLAAVTDFRCAAHQYRQIAAGHCHVQMFRRLYPWDHAAGYLLHREAGGYAKRFDGSDYRPSDIDGGLLLAPDEASWHAIAKVFLP